MLKMKIEQDVIDRHEHLGRIHIDWVLIGAESIEGRIANHVYGKLEVEGDRSFVELLTDELLIDVSNTDDIPLEVRFDVSEANLEDYTEDRYLNTVEAVAERSGLYTVKVGEQWRQVALYEIRLVD